MDFTPKQLHYFKRELITEEIKKELQLLKDTPDILPITSKQPEVDNQFPFLRYIFHHLIIEFPLLKHTADDDFWLKCKVFFDEFNKSQLDTFYTPQQSESNMQRRIIRHKIEKSFVFAFCASIKTIQGKEESIRIHSTPTSPTPTPTSSNKLKINIVGVRQVKIKKALMETSHAEFIIETYLHSEPIYVAHRHGDFRRLRDQLRRQFSDIPLVPSKSNHHAQGYRENDRLLLRAWLSEVIEKVQHKNPALVSFLTDNPIVYILDQDANQRQEWDQLRLKEQEKYQQEVEKRVHELNDTLDELKKQVVQPGGLIKLFDAIKTTEKVQDLPNSLKKAFEWGRINFAFVLHKHFIGSDTAVDNVDKLRKTHGLMPYKTLSVILRFSNPISMVKSVLDLFLAQPFGGKSLLQRMIISNLSDESKSYQKDIKVLKAKINNDVLCDKLYNAVRTHVSEDAEFKSCKSKTLELLDILANNNDIQPTISAEQVTEIANSNKQTKRLLKLWELYAKQYEHELLQDLFFQGLTGELIREFISVFYQPLAQVYKAADISTTIRQAGHFVDDLLSLVDKIYKQNEQETSIQQFIDLVQRHEHHFYEFVHNVHSQEASNVFDELIQYLDRLFTFIAEGIPGKIDMNHCIEQAGIKDVSELEQEINALCEYRHQQKVHRFERQKKKMQHGANMDAQMHKDDIFEFIPDRNEIVNALDEFDDFEEESSSDDSSSSSDSESSSVDDSRRRSSELSGASQLSYAGIEFPQLTIIPKILPWFIKDVSKMIYS